MEMVTEYLFRRFIGISEPLPFPDYLLPKNRYKNDFWITQEGEIVYPWQMDNRHLLNTIRMIDRSNPQRKMKYIDCNGDKYVLYGKADWVPQGTRKTGINIAKLYYSLWDEQRLYMLLRREVKLRGLEKEL